MISPKNKETTLEKLRPVRVVDAKELTNYFPKDEIFDRIKSYLNKNKPDQKFLEADWRHVNLGGSQIVLIKGQAVTKTELSYFSDAAKAHYLNEVGKRTARDKKAEKLTTEKLEEEVADKLASDEKELAEAIEAEEAAKKN